MGLSNSMREILIDLQNRNNYESNLKPMSKQTEFSTVENLHQKTIIEIDKTIKLSKKNVKKKEEIVIDKVIEELSDNEDTNEDTPEEITKIRNSYSDLKTSTLNDIEYMDYDKLDKTEPISQDISSDNIESSTPLLEESKLDEEISTEDTLEETLETLDDIEVKSNDKRETDMKKGMGSETSGGGNIDNMFFGCLDRIHKKGGNNPIKQTHVTKELSGGDRNFKKIKLTEKYDFF